LVYGVFGLCSSVEPILRLFSDPSSGEQSDSRLTWLVELYYA